jgi:hypothetical protein
VPLIMCFLIKRIPRIVPLIGSIAIYNHASVLYNIPTISTFDFCPLPLAV